MRIKVLYLWERVRSSFWFIPSCMSVAAAALALVATRGDRYSLGLLSRGEPEAARTLLATVAGSMITVAGVTFSVTVVALSLASSQLGPRLLVNFMRDRGNQLVLGTFIATFLFCLVALATSSSSEATPALSAALGLGLAVVSVGVLIYFIHHVSSSINAERVIESVAHDLERAVDHIFPEDEGATTEPEHSVPGSNGEGSVLVVASTSGYIQGLDEERLIALAEESNVVLRAVRRPGHFVVEGEPLLMALERKQLSPILAERAWKCFIVGRQRTQEQDPEYGIHQLVEVAVRALSPGVNDPYTAISCVDWLGAILCRIGARQLRAPTRCGSDGTLRLIVDPITFEGILAAAFNQIRQCAQSSPAVSIRMLESLAGVGRVLEYEDRRSAARAQADIVFRGAMSSSLQECDRRDLEDRHRRALEMLAGTAEAAHG